MTVLVDEARWEWRGARWAHLVSDVTHAELHEFARTIGKRRLGFQGDHYDVDETDRARAIESGATPVPSRELVRRLREAGLRARGEKPRWERIADWPDGVGATTLAGRLADVGPPASNDFGGSLAAAGWSAHHPTALFVDHQWCVVLVELGPSAPSPSGIAADLVWAGGPRADGNRSLELFLRR